MTVHPHVRGDDSSTVGSFAAASGSPPRAWGRRKIKLAGFSVHGSPPRAWGRRSRLRAVLSSVRFTPTCVGTTQPTRACVDATSVHPHVRGDDVIYKYERHRHNGSPPRAWGRLRSTSSCTSGDPVHPHVRGDDLSAAAAACSAAGSPPRAWGRRGNQTHQSSPVRFTPTCVGTTVRCRPCPGGPSVHPHVRGDDYETLKRAPKDSGSPPRAWGRLTGSVRVHSDRRFTPTCVGTTLTTA